MPKKETVVNDARLMVIRLDPYRSIDRVGKVVQIRFVQLHYNMTRLLITAKVLGPTLDAQGRPTGPQRSIIYEDRKDFPFWLEKLVEKYMPDAFHDPSRVKRADRVAAHDAALRGAIPPNSHPDMIMEVGL